MTMTIIGETTGRGRASNRSHCIGCNTPFRPRHMTISEAPGTKLHTGQGLCQPCRRQRTAPAAQPGRGEEAARQAFELFIRERRRRGIPPEGTMPEDDG